MGAIEWGERRAMDPPQPPPEPTHALIHARQAAMVGDPGTSMASNPGTSMAHRVLASSRVLRCTCAVLAEAARPVLSCDIWLLIMRFALGFPAAEALRFRADPGPHEALRAWLGRHYFGGQPWPRLMATFQPGQQYFRVPWPVRMRCTLTVPIESAGLLWATGGAGVPAQWVSGAHPVPARWVRFTDPTGYRIEVVVSVLPHFGGMTPFLSGLYRVAVSGPTGWKLQLTPAGICPHKAGPKSVARQDEAGHGAG